MVGQLSGKQINLEGILMGTSELNTSFGDRLDVYGGFIDLVGTKASFVSFASRNRHGFTNSRAWAPRPRHILAVQAVVKASIRKEPFRSDLGHNNAIRMSVSASKVLRIGLEGRKFIWQ